MVYISLVITNCSPEKESGSFRQTKTLTKIIIVFLIIPCIQEIPTDGTSFDVEIIFFSNKIKRCLDKESNIGAFTYKVNAFPIKLFRPTTGRLFFY